MSEMTDAMENRQRRTGTFLLALLLLSFVAVGVRIVHINRAHGASLRAQAARQHRSRAIVPARRGTIFDARGRAVAVSRQMPDVFVDPARSEDLVGLAGRLSPRINVSAQDILNSIRARPDSRYIVVARGVDRITADAVRALNDPAVGLTQRLVRSYPLGRSMATVIGIVNRDQQGLEGIELQFDKHLSGMDGERDTIRDARRRALWRSASQGKPPRDGGHLVLTIDAAIQRFAEEALATTVMQFEAESGVVVVMSPRSGDILAMASVPTFDPNHPNDFPMDARRNRAVTDALEPGSTFKPIIACGALDGGFVSPTEQIDCHNGVYRFGRRRVKDTRPHGLLDLRGIITVSSNIGMATIATRMGNPPLYDTIRRFGFGETTGLRFPGEDDGLVRPLDKWTSYSTTSVCMGYEIGVTPLQLITAFVGIINDGLLIRPRLVRQLLAPDGRVMEQFEGPEVVRRVATPEVARFVSRDLMRSVVEHGGGSAAKLGGYSVMGKTGTSKLVYRDRPGYEPGQYSCAFVGAAPVDDPQVVVLVMVRRPDAHRGYYGGKVAAPAAGKIIAQTLAYWQVPPDEAVSSATGRR